MSYAPLGCDIILSTKVKYSNKEKEVRTMNYNTNCCNKGRRIIGLLLGICLLLGLLGGFSSCVTREDIIPVTAITSVELNQSVLTLFLLSMI